MKVLACITALLLFEGCATADYAGIPLQPGRAAPEVQEIARLARAGDKQAQFDLGKRFETGDGVAQNRAQAMTLYRMAARDEPGTQWVFAPSPGGGAPAMVMPVRTGVPRQGLDAAKRRLAYDESAFETLSTKKGKHHD